MTPGGTFDYVCPDQVDAHVAMAVKMENLEGFKPSKPS